MADVYRCLVIYEAEGWCRCILIHPSEEKNVSRRSGTFLTAFDLLFFITRDYYSKKKIL